MSKNVPYENATSGHAARNQIVDLLDKFGCEQVGFMDNFKNHEVILAFVYRGKNIQLTASAKGWAAMYLKEKPYSNRYHRRTRQEYEQAAFRQGLIAVNSVLRDWVKGQITAIECGILKFDHVFLPYTLLEDGRSVMQALDEAGILKLEAPE